jgi:hypothetical protein
MNGGRKKIAGAMTASTKAADMGAAAKPWGNRIARVAAAGVIGMVFATTIRVPQSTAGEQEVPTPDLGSCRFQLPRNASTIAYYTYGGSQASKYRLFYEPNTYLGRQPVVIPKRETPIFVVLVSSGPTEWDLRIQPEAQVAAVLVLGYQNQIVSNIPQATSIGFSIYAGEHGRDCPTNSSWWANKSLTEVLPPMLEHEFGRSLNEYYNSGYEDCSYFLCERSPKIVDKSVPSFWSRLFGAAKPGGVVRTSARLILR